MILMEKFNMNICKNLKDDFSKLSIKMLNEPCTLILN